MAYTDPPPPSAPPPWEERLKRGGKWRSALIVVGCILLAAVVVWFLTQQAHTKAAGQRRGRPSATVAMAVATRGDMPVSLDALGTVTPVSTVTVTSLVSGQLMRVDFVEGQMVRAGQVLVQIDPRPYQLALQQAQGQLLRDEAALDNARLDLKRYRALLAQDSIARQQVETQAALVKQNEGVVATDRAAVGTARLNLANTRITAPVSGRVGLRKVDVGNYVQAGAATGVAVITVVQPIDVAFSVPEDQVGVIQARSRAGAVLAVTAFDRTRTTALGQGTFLTLDNQVDTSTGTVAAKARFANADGALFPNQFVNVRMLVNTLGNVVLIPASAVRRGPKGDFVFVVTDDRVAHVTIVKLGPVNGEVVSVASGLNGGEKLVTEGGDRLTDGAKVVLPGERPQFGGRGQKGRKSSGLFGWLFGGGKAASSDQASQAGGSGGQGGGGQRVARIEQQLGLDADQKAKADVIFAESRQQAMSQAGDDPDARRAAMRASMQQALARLEPILRPDQKAKLAQVRAQMAAGRQGGGGSQ